MKERGQEGERERARKQERDAENKHSLRHKIRFRNSQKRIKGDKADLSEECQISVSGCQY